MRGTAISTRAATLLLSGLLAVAGGEVAGAMPALPNAIHAASDAAVSGVQPARYRRSETRAARIERRINRRYRCDKMPSRC